MPIVSRVLKSKERFVAKYHGIRFVIQADEVEENKWSFHMLEPKGYKGPQNGSKSFQGGADGRTFSSLSSAASAITLPGLRDGWIFWTREKDWSEDLAVNARGGRSVVGTKAKAVRPAAAKSKPAATKAVKPPTKAEGVSKESKPTSTTSSRKAGTVTTRKATKTELKEGLKSPKATRGAAKATVKSVAEATGKRTAPAKVKARRTRAAKEEPEELDI